MLTAGSRWRDIQASADHLSFNQLEDRIKPIRSKVRMGQKAFSLGQLRMTLWTGFEPRTSQTKRPLLVLFGSEVGPAGPVLAERGGFEPPRPVTQSAAFRVRCVQPLCHLSKRRSGKQGALVAWGHLARKGEAGAVTAPGAARPDGGRLRGRPRCRRTRFHPVR